MTLDIGWGADLVSTGEFSGLESFNPDMGPNDQQGVASNFKPINIVADNGAFYATLYVCHCLDETIASQQLSIWLSSLKDTDTINLTVLSLLSDIPLPMMINLMSALTSTKANLNIYLDQIVVDNLAYFYLIPEKITKGTEGALFIPSYMVHREEDASGPQRAVYDFYKWVVSEAVTKGILTAEEADRLHSGSHVVVDDNRFAHLA